MSFWLLVLLLFGRDRRWYVAQIAQLSLVLLASLGAIYFVDDIIWVFLAWSFFVIFVVVPRSMARLAMQWLSLGHWPKSARMWKLAARFSWGQTGQLYRRTGNLSSARMPTGLRSCCCPPGPAKSKHCPTTLFVPRPRNGSRTASEFSLRAAKRVSRPGPTSRMWPEERPEP